jgi:hypothetical protein
MGTHNFGLSDEDITLKQQNKICEKVLICESRQSFGNGYRVSVIKSK